MIPTHRARVVACLLLFAEVSWATTECEDAWLELPWWSGHIDHWNELSPTEEQLQDVENTMSKLAAHLDREDYCRLASIRVVIGRTEFGASFLKTEEGGEFLIDADYLPSGNESQRRRTRSDLATLLAHEMGHALGGHGTDREGEWRADRYARQLVCTANIDRGPNPFFRGTNVRFNRALRSLRAATDEGTGPVDEGVPLKTLERPPAPDCLDLLATISRSRRWVAEDSTIRSIYSTVREVCVESIDLLDTAERWTGSTATSQVAALRKDLATIDRLETQEEDSYDFPACRHRRAWARDTLFTATVTAGVSAIFDSDRAEMVPSGALQVGWHDFAFGYVLPVAGISLACEEGPISACSGRRWFPYLGATLILEEAAYPAFNAAFGLGFGPLWSPRTNPVGGAGFFSFTLGYGPGRSVSFVAMSSLGAAFNNLTKSPSEGEASGQLGMRLHL